MRRRDETPDPSGRTSGRASGIGHAEEVDVVIRGHHLPGKDFRNACVPIHQVHVGVQVRADPTDLVRGDAESAEWHVAVRVVEDENGLDFRGPAVHGRRGERFLYLTWGDVGTDGSFAMFRRAKLMLDTVDPTLVRAAERTRRALVASIDLADDHGGPRCGRVGPAALVWSV